MAKQYDVVVKLLGIGDSGVGKTCLICRFAEDTFQAKYGATIGIDFKMKKTNIDGRQVRIQLWDTAGQERFETLTRHYFRHAQGIFIVYDITSEKSFDHLSKWIKMIKESAEEDVVLLLLGNKVDKDDMRAISTERGQMFAKNLKMEFYETSAKDSTNIDEAFTGLAKLILQKHKKEYDNLKLTHEENDCCQPASEVLRTQDNKGCCFG